MQRPTLLKTTEGLELWASQSDTGPAFGVKHHSRRMRLAATLTDAEALFDRLLGAARLARAH